MFIGLMRAGKEPVGGSVQDAPAVLGHDGQLPERYADDHGNGITRIYVDPPEAAKTSAPASFGPLRIIVSFIRESCSCEIVLFEMYPQIPHINQSCVLTSGAVFTLLPLPGFRRL